MGVEEYLDLGLPPMDRSSPPSMVNTYARPFVRYVMGSNLLFPRPPPPTLQGCHNYWWQRRKLG